MNVKRIVGHVGGRCKGTNEEQAAWQDAPVESAHIRSAATAMLERVLRDLNRNGDRRQFLELERTVRTTLFALGRLLLAYYLCLRHERSEPAMARWRKRGFGREALRKRELETSFGRICYWRTHMRGVSRRGIFPLDLALGLTADRFSFFVAETAARLSTIVS